MNARRADDESAQAGERTANEGEATVTFDRAIVVRDQLRAGLRVAALGNSKTLAAIDGAYGTAKDHDALSKAIDKLVAIARVALEKKTPIGHRLAKAKVTVKWLDEVEAVGKTVKACSSG